MIRIQSHQEPSYVTPVKRPLSVEHFTYSNKQTYHTNNIPLNITTAPRTTRISQIQHQFSKPSSSQVNRVHFHQKHNPQTRFSSQQKSNRSSQMVNQKRKRTMFLTVISRLPGLPDKSKPTRKILF